MKMETVLRGGSMESGGPTGATPHLKQTCLRSYYLMRCFADVLTSCTYLLNINGHKILYDIVYVLCVEA